jgi:hypothetical protein
MAASDSSYNIDDYRVSEESYTYYGYPHLGDPTQITRVDSHTNMRIFSKANEVFERKKNEIWQQEMLGGEVDDDMRLFNYECMMERGFSVVYEGGGNWTNDRKTFVFEYNHKNGEQCPRSHSDSS